MFTQNGIELREIPGFPGYWITSIAQKASWTRIRKANHSAKMRVVWAKKSKEEMKKIGIKRSTTCAIKRESKQLKTQNL